MADFRGKSTEPVSKPGCEEKKKERKKRKRKATRMIRKVNAGTGAQLLVIKRATRLTQAG